MNQVPLSKGLFAVVDDCDMEQVHLHKWSAAFRGCKIYARARIGGRSIYMHRFILKPSHGEMIDHVDGNGLNNTRENLRIASRSENCANSGARKNSKTGLKGVFPLNGKFLSQITFNGKKIYIGFFADEHDAATAYNQAAKRFFGGFAKLNDIKNKI